MAPSFRYSKGQAGVFFHYRGQYLETASRFQPPSDHSSDPATSAYPSMDANTVLPLHFNLTGQVTIQNIPDFMGNYSFVYRGIVHGNPVSVLYESISNFTC
jgi:hypothetical protein